MQLTHPDKILFPESGITKRDVAEYYAGVSHSMLPFLVKRPIALRRYPKGISEEGFFQKEASGIPGIGTAAVQHSEGVKNYAVLTGAEDLQRLVEEDVIELHAFLSTTAHLHVPDRMVFDLDPSKMDDFGSVQDGARRLKELLERLGAHPLVKTTGGKGLHVIVPLVPEEDFDAVREFSKALARRILEHAPERFTLKYRKNARHGKVLIDCWRNAFGQTAVAPYSVRARPSAPVAAPLTWEEALDPSFSPQRYTVRNMHDRLQRVGDVWKGQERPARLKTMRDASWDQ